jgi:hypothetical protein
MGEPAQPTTTSTSDAQSGAASDTSTSTGQTSAAAQNGAQSRTAGDQHDDGELARVRAALADERRLHADTQRQLASARQQGMTDEERRLDEARAEGRTAAIREAGLRVAAAEFRAAAVGQLTDPTAALEVLDLSRFVDDDGQVDTRAIERLVAKLAKSLPAPPAGTVPPGPRGADPADSTDFVRGALGRRP